MKKIACLTFTCSGKRLASRIQAQFPGQTDIFTKQTYKKHLPRIFNEYRGIVFICAAGIAVRLSAPFVRDKTSDPAVVVVDDLGRYAISLLSGHLGGANALAITIADTLKCLPIITTASDARGFEAPDLFARRNDLIIEDFAAVTTITAMMVKGNPIQLISEIPLSLDYPFLVEDSPAGRIYVTSRERVACDIAHCLLRPKNLNIGIGCRREKSKEAILHAVTQVLQTHNLCRESIKAFATIELKKDEPGLLDVCRTLQRPLRWFRKQEIRRVQDRFSASAFVRRSIGVSAVCEPCAYLAGGELIVNKTVVDGVTIAVAKE